MNRVYMAHRWEQGAVQQPGGVQCLSPQLKAPTYVQGGLSRPMRQELPGCLSPLPCPLSSFFSCHTDPNRGFLSIDPTPNHRILGPFSCVSDIAFCQAAS